MCEKCVELDLKIERCRRLLALSTDQMTVDGISRLLEGYAAEKHGWHPDWSTGSEPSGSQL